MTNFLLHKHRKEDENFKRPDGLTELLSDISREVLRAQPECVYTFVADYLEAMLVTREQSLIAQRAFTTIVDLSMTVCDMMRHVGISRERAEESCMILETEFKKAMSNEPPNEEIGISEDSAMIVEGLILEKLRSKLSFGMEELRKTQRIIQVCFKDFYFREKEFSLKINRLPYDHWANQVEKTLEIYKKSGPARWELERAATAIQAGYRGYYSRKRNKDIAMLNKQAVIIQSNYRGYLGRKQVFNLLNNHSSSGEEPPMIVPKQSLRSIFSVTEKNTDSKEFRAATKIQASYRGHLVRKHLQVCNLEESNLPEPRSDEEVPDSDACEIDNNSGEIEAATKIQAAYRGHLVRKSIPKSVDEQILKENAKEEIEKHQLQVQNKYVEEEINTFQPEVQNKYVEGETDIVQPEAPNENIEPMESITEKVEGEPDVKPMERTKGSVRSETIEGSVKSKQSIMESPLPNEEIVLIVSSVHEADSHIKLN